uniref:Vesicle associated membrane protein 3 n=1 Tax=Bos mutus grunniens TaxID=30521 RepID=A0A8B9XJ22_BOSMU
MTTNAPAGSSAAAGSSRRLQQTQNQVDEVVDIMRVNVDKVLERDQKLSELDDRADALQAGASQFETSAAKLKRKYWWKNCKNAPCFVADLQKFVETSRSRISHRLQPLPALHTDRRGLEQEDVGDRNHRCGHHHHHHCRHWSE